MRIQVVRRLEFESIWPYEFESPEQKGYPDLFENAVFWILYEEDDPIAYTCSASVDLFTIVGNTYVRKEHRGKGYHSKILSERNKRLSPRPKVCVLNPIENTPVMHLENVVRKLGYTRLTSWDDAEDIMLPHTWDSHFKDREVWRLH